MGELGIVEPAAETATSRQDEALMAALRDPSRIATHEQAVEILAALDADIADITSQLEAYQAEAAFHGTSEERRTWATRALYARALKRQQVHKVSRRDRELRGIPRAAPDPPKDRAVALAREARLQAEAEARTAERRARGNEANLKVAEGAALRRIERQFIDAARERLPAAEFEAIWTAASGRLERAKERHAG